jgi:hypothetical protein
MKNEIRPNKSGAAGDDNVSHIFSPRNFYHYSRLSASGFWLLATEASHLAADRKPLTVNRA